MSPKGRISFLRTLFDQSARTPPPDQRPVSGMVGQKNLASLTDPWGKTIRFVPGERGPDDVTPVTYNPAKPDTFTKEIRISPNSRRFEFMRPSYPVGPGDHPCIPAAPGTAALIRGRPAVLRLSRLFPGIFPIRTGARRRGSFRGSDSRASALRSTSARVSSPHGLREHFFLRGRMIIFIICRRRLAPTGRSRRASSRRRSCWEEPLVSNDAGDIVSFGPSTKVWEWPSVANNSSSAVRSITPCSISVSRTVSI